VPEVRTPQSILRFKGFELDLRSGELRRDGGSSVRLSEQPFRILVLLLEHPQEVITREEIRKQLWPNDTIVEFEHSISAAMNRLRQALGDSAEHPHYIETLARRGYRWMVPVQRAPCLPDLADATASALAVSPESLLGRKVSHYRVLELVGGGGMGVVYKAEDLKLGRRVALKFLPDELTKDPVALGRFEREARSASSLDHPNICAVHEFDEHDGQPFIVMQLLEGQTLRERIAGATGQGTALPIDELIRVAIQISEGLEVAHRNGIIHRDIKPANIFITNRGEAKILDFGLAKLHGTTQDVSIAILTQDMKVAGSMDLSSIPTSSAAALALSKTGQTMGTAFYMSPEQVRCEELDGRTDLFSLGLVLYEMATSQQAFAGPTAAMVHNAILHHIPTSARAFNPSLPRKVDEIITKCIQKDRELRYQSAGELAADLKQIRLHIGSGKRLWLEKFRSRKIIGLAAVAVVLLLLVAIGRFSVLTSEEPLGAVEVVPLASVPPGHQHRASFSPDGNQLVFDQGGDQFCNRDESCGIYTTVIDGEKPLRLTHNESDCCPRWSPDGKQIAFSRQVEGGTAVYLISALGGSERRLYVGPFTYDGYLDWSPDGKILAITQTSPGKNSGRIALLSVDDSTTTPLTDPPGQYLDSGPVFSPDGSTIAFIRRTVSFIDADVFVVPITGGEPKRLTFDSRGMDSPLTWSADGRDILFSSARKGLPTLWRVSASGGEPRPVAGVGTMAFCPSVSRKGHQLIYQNQLRNDNIWRVQLTDETHIKGSPSVLISSNVGMNWRPDFSPDGKRIAFESSRSGYAEIWACDTDGTNCSPLTSLHGVAGTPRWSPDGRHIAFEFHPGAHSEIYVLEVGSGPPHLVHTRSGAENLAPSWSRDGQWIYFASDRGEGRFQLWKVRLQGGPPIQVTRNGGVYGVESADQKFLYYAKFEANGIWRMPLPGGEETEISSVMDSTGGSDWYNWALARNGIYFLNRAAEPKEAIEYFDLATRKTSTILVPDRRADFGVALSPDERLLVYPQNDVYQSNLVLMKNFR
jgi:Tol biopolymer transport system component/serine/threonine protein kinase